MVALLPRGGWGLVKPPAGVQIDRGHPLAQGLVSLWPVNEGGGGILQDVAGENPIRLQGSPQWQPGQLGPDFQCSSSQYGVAYKATSFTTDRATFAVWLRLDTAFAAFQYNGILVNRGTVTQGMIVGLGGYLGYIWNDSSATYDWNSNLTVPTGRWSLCVVSVDPVQVKVFMNGQAVVRANSHASVTFNAQWYLGTDSNATGTRFVPGAFAGAAVWRRALSLGEIQGIYADPWQMFAPPVWRRYVVPSVGGGGGTAYTQSVGGTLTSSGTLVKQDRKPLAGSMATAGALTKQERRALTGTLTTAGTVVKQPQKPLAGTLTTAGSIVRRPARALAGTLTTAGALAAQKTLLRALAGTLTSAGSLVKQSQKPLGGTLTTAGAVARQVTYPLAGTLATSGTLVKKTNRALAGTVTTAGALAAQKTLLRALSATLVTAGALARLPQKALAGTLTTSGISSMRTSRALAGTLSTAGTVVKRTNRALAGSLTTASALTGVKGLTKSLGGTLATAGTVARRIDRPLTGTLASAGTITRRVTRSLGGSLGLAGNLVSLGGIQNIVTAVASAAVSLYQRASAVISRG